MDIVPAKINMESTKTIEQKQTMTESLLLPQTSDIWENTLKWQPNPEQWQQFQHLY